MGELIPDWREERTAELLRQSIEQNESRKPEKWWQVELMRYHDAYIDLKSENAALRGENLKLRSFLGDKDGRFIAGLEAENKELRDNQGRP